MSLNFKFLDYKSIDKVIEFFNSAQSDKVQSNNRPREEFEWLFFNGPYKPAIYSMAIDETSGEIVGTYAGIFIPMISKDGRYIITLKGEDTLISLDRSVKFGMRDIMKDLIDNVITEAVNDNTAFVWGFAPIRRELRRCGFQIVTQLKGSFYVIKPLEFFKNRLKQFPHLSLLKKLLIFGFSFYCFVHQKLNFSKGKGITLRDISFNDLDESLLLSFIPKNVFTTRLSKDFLKWRVADNPSGNNYGFLETRDNAGEILSYIIYSYNKEQIWFIEQMLFRYKLKEEIKVRIIKKAVRYFKMQNAIAARATGFDHNDENIKEIALLKRSGFHFFKNREESYFVFYNLSETVIDPHDIYLSRLNAQGIR